MDNEQPLEIEFPLNVFEELKAVLEVQAKDYIELKEEADGGPAPSNTSSTAGGNEKKQIKNYSRHPYGRTIIQTYVGSAEVLTIVNGDGEQSEFYEWWMESRMNHKLKITLEDSYIGGSGYIELYKNKDGELSGKVTSPKNMAILSNNRANEEFAVYGVEKLEYNGETVYKVWDDTYEYIFENKAKRGTAKWVQTWYYPHNLGICPILFFDDYVQSDGTVESSIQILKPVLQTMRLVTNAASQGAYWQGLKQMIIGNVDRNQTRLDESDEPVTLYEDILNELHKSDENEALILPASDTPGAPGPALIQTQEANLAQLGNVVKETKNTVAALSAIPLQRLDPSATPETAEGSAQSYMALDALMTTKRSVAADKILSMYRVWAKINGKDIDWGTKVVWAATDRSSLNSLADTVAKLSATGIPLGWIVNTIISKGGFTPGEIDDLQNRIEEQMSRNDQITGDLLALGANTNNE